MNSTPALAFKSKTFNVIDRNGQPWLTLSEIAAALYEREVDPLSKRGSQKTTPFESRVRDLYRRHADEFTSGMTALVEMVTAGGKQMVRIFSLRGAHLLAMFARTPVAKEFRAWVLDVLDREVARLDVQPQQVPLRDGLWYVKVVSGQIAFQLGAAGCYLIRAEELPKLVREPAQIPIDLLPKIIAAASERLTPWVENHVRRVRA